MCRSIICCNIRICYRWHFFGWLFYLNSAWIIIANLIKSFVYNNVLINISAVSLFISDISVLLFLGKRFMKCLKFKSLHNIISVTKPQKHLITGLDTLCCETYAMIQVCQLIYPFFLVVVLFVLFKNSYSLFKAYILCLVKLVLKDIPSSIPWSYSYEFFVILNCLNKLAHFNSKFAQRINYSPTCRVSIVSHKENISALFIAPVYLIQIAYHAKHLHASDLFPVDCVRDPNCFGKSAFPHQSFYFVSSDLVLNFIQNIHLFGA